MRSELLARALSQEVFRFMSEHVDLLDEEKTEVLMTSTQFNIDYIQKNNLENIVNLRRANDFRFINKVLEAVNQKLPKGGLFISCIESRSLRKKRILVKYPPVLNYIYYGMDFIFKRVFPKLPVLKKFYFFITAGRNRHISKAEALGRLYSCGFKVRELFFFRNLMYIVAEKVKSPDYNTNPSYGLIFKMRRIGKGGKEIFVYKLRTMHPYSEYLQEFVYENYELKEGGKFANDFRISTMGRLFRKIWLDELPMAFNILRGEMKLVGVRPLSKHYLELYNKDLQELRAKFKPGLIPPFYVDMPKTLEEIQESEKKYLEAYQQAPFRTDVRYFFNAFLNIVFRGARSG